MKGVYRAQNPETAIRAAFWIVGITLGTALIYTTRFFYNGDALTYIEMGEGFRLGEWFKLINLGCSPAYPMILGAAQKLIGTTPLNELPLLKSVGLFGLVLSMGACDMIVEFMKQDYESQADDSAHFVDFAPIRAVIYGLFLVTALMWIRVRMLNPDMFVLFAVLSCVAAVLWIREEPDSYLRYIVMGVAAGTAYYFKTYLLFLAPVFLGLGFLVAGSVRKAIPRTVVAAMCFVVVISPLIIVLSDRAGRFSFGEVGNVAFAEEYGDRGSPKNPPIVLHDKPRTLFYPFDTECTDSSSFDVGYWSVGMSPKIDLFRQLKGFARNIGEILDAALWAAVVPILWIAAALRHGGFRRPTLFPIPMSAVCILSGLAGMTLFCLVLVETRLVAPYIFLGFLGLMTLPSGRVRDGERKRRISLLMGAAVLYLSIGICIDAVNQFYRGLNTSSSKLSFMDGFREFESVKAFLESKGLSKGDEVALVGWPYSYWARMGGLKITCRIPNKDQFLGSDAQSRQEALNSLSEEGVKAIVGKGEQFGSLVNEKWEKVSGTRDYFVNFLRP